MKFLYFEAPSHLVFKWRLDHLAQCGRSSRSCVKRDETMPLLSEHLDPVELSDRLRDAHAVTSEVMAEVIGEIGKHAPRGRQRINVVGDVFGLRHLRRNLRRRQAQSLLEPFRNPMRFGRNRDEWMCAHDMTEQGRARSRTSDDEHKRINHM